MENPCGTYFPGKKQFAYTFEDPLLSRRCASSFVNRILPSLLVIVSAAFEVTEVFVPPSITPAGVQSSGVFDRCWRHYEIKFQFSTTQMQRRRGNYDPCIAMLCSRALQLREENIS
jgi:hypothetical protein